jgi:hypothetical protein
MSEEIMAAILEMMKKKRDKGKTKLNIKEIVKEFPDFSRTDVKVAAQQMLDDEVLAYWSSGSTTYLMLKEEFEKYKEQAEGGE